MSITSRTTPTVIPTSATLKVGQWWLRQYRSRKSTTYPSRARSIRFPIAPPRMSPRPTGAAPLQGRYAM